MGDEDLHVRRLIEDETHYFQNTINAQEFLNCPGGYYCSFITRVGEDSRGDRRKGYRCQFLSRAKHQ